MPIPYGVRMSSTHVSNLTFDIHSPCQVSSGASPEGQSLGFPSLTWKASVFPSFASEQNWAW
ncbi:hypothetical protein GCM10020255_024170 [Rhodococcus baikonurensis]